MSSPINALSLNAALAAIARHPRCKILESRTQYQCCHIQVPDNAERLAAIRVDGKYFSLFRVVKNRSKALQIAARLVYRGDDVVITTTVKGDVVWAYEPDAEPSPSRSGRSVVSRMPRSVTPAISEDGLWQLMTSDREYQPCQIFVPDIMKPLSAIVVEQKFYSFLRMVRNQAQGIELAERLARKGNQTVITPMGQSCAIWVLEVDAEPAE